MRHVLLAVADLSIRFPRCTTARLRAEQRRMHGRLATMVTDAEEQARHLGLGTWRSGLEVASRSEIS